MITYLMYLYILIGVFVFFKFYKPIKTDVVQLWWYLVEYGVKCFELMITVAFWPMLLIMYYNGERE